jgi:hypothetical protein
VGESRRAPRHLRARRGRRPTWTERFADTDSVHSVELHHFHEGDVYNPIEPGTLFTRLQTIGFDHIAVAVDWGVRFRARKPPRAEVPG